MPPRSDTGCHHGALLNGEGTVTMRPSGKLSEAEMSDVVAIAESYGMRPAHLREIAQESPHVNREAGMARVEPEHTIDRPFHFGESQSGPRRP